MVLSAFVPLETGSSTLAECLDATGPCLCAHSVIVFTLAVQMWVPSTSGGAEIAFIACSLGQILPPLTV